MTLGAAVRLRRMRSCGEWSFRCGTTRSSCRRPAASPRTIRPATRGLRISSSRRSSRNSSRLVRLHETPRQQFAAGVFFVDGASECHSCRRGVFEWGRCSSDIECLLPLCVMMWSTRRSVSFMPSRPMAVRLWMQRSTSSSMILYGADATVVHGHHGREYGGRDAAREAFMAQLGFAPSQIMPVRLAIMFLTAAAACS